MPLSYHIKGLIGPEFDEIIEFWITNNKITFNEVKNSKSLSGDGKNFFILPGLVDAHVHLTMDLDKLVRQNIPDSGYLTHDYILNRKNQHFHSGELLLRDVGQFRNMHHETFKKFHPVTLQSAGRFLAPDKGFFPFVESTSGEDLIKEALKQVELGYQWVKIIGSWDEHRLNYDEEIIYSLVKEVHKAGSRVVMHAESKDSVAVAVNTGVDSIEHGIFLNKEQIDQMVDNKTAWTPTSAMYYKELNDYPDNKTLKSVWESLEQMVPYAQEQGVSIMTGTDIFPPGSVHLEINALVKLGLTIEQALNAATTTPRKFLHQQGIEENAPADLVLYHNDPKIQSHKLNKPDFVFGKGIFFQN